MAAANRPYDLGCFYCGQPGVALPVNAPSSGTFQAFFCYAGTEVCTQFQGVVGEPLVVPLGNLGAPYVYEFRVLDPEGDPVEFYEDDTDLLFTCWALCLKVALVGEAVMLNMAGVTCENLNDEEHGLTVEQRLECILPRYDFSDPATLDALTDQQDTDLGAAYGDGGSCAPATVLRDGIPYGTVASGGTIDVPSAPCDPLGYDLHNSEDTVILSGTLSDPCGATLELVAPDATVQLEDEKGRPIGERVAFPSGTSGALTAPSVHVQLQDSALDPIGAELVIHSGEPLETITAPDGQLYATDGTTPVLSIKSDGSEAAPQSVIKYKDSADASQVTSPSDTEFAAGTFRPAEEVPRRELKYSDGTGTGIFATLARLIAGTIPNLAIKPDLASRFTFPSAGDDTSVLYTVPVGGLTIGSYTSIAQDGSSGTITVSVNGGAYGAFAAFSLAEGDTIQFKRSAYAAPGWVEITGTFTP